MTDNENLQDNGDTTTAINTDGMLELVIEAVAQAIIVDAKNAAWRIKNCLGSALQALPLEDPPHTNGIAEARRVIDLAIQELAALHERMAARCQ